jgi:hypothetical protein
MLGMLLYFNLCPDVLNLNTLRAGTSGLSRETHVSDCLPQPQLQPQLHAKRLVGKKRGRPKGKKPMTQDQIVLAKSREKTGEAAQKVLQQPDLPVDTDHILFQLC